MVSVCREDHYKLFFLSEEENFLTLRKWAFWKISQNFVCYPKTFPQSSLNSSSILGNQQCKMANTILEIVTKHVEMTYGFEKKIYSFEKST